MNKKVKLALLLLMTPFAAFLLLSFVIAQDYNANFWCGIVTVLIAWGIMIPVILQTYKKQKQESSAFFLNSPLLLLCGIHLCVQFLLGIAVMAIPNYGAKTSAIISFLVLAIFSIIAIALVYYRAKTIDAVVLRRDERVFIKELQKMLNEVLLRSNNAIVKRSVAQVIDASKYCNPNSVDAFREDEKRLLKLAFSLKENTQNPDVASVLCNEMEILLKKRDLLS